MNAAVNIVAPAASVAAAVGGGRAVDVAAAVIVGCAGTAAEVKVSTPSSIMNDIV